MPPGSLLLAALQTRDTFDNKISHEFGFGAVPESTKRDYPLIMQIEEESRRRLDAAREYLEQARMAESPDLWREWARRLLQNVPGPEADDLRSECTSKPSR
jgi:hypothetical protein